jgi:hypothetical protein
MKVFIGKYLNFIGPYQIAEALCFWAKRDEYGQAPDWVYNFGRWLSVDKNGNDSWLAKLCQWAYDKRQRKIKIKLHNYDTWNMDATLALIIVPMLKQLKETSNSLGNIHPDDCPPELRGNFDIEVHDTHYSPERWGWFMDELIWTFTQLDPHTNGESQFFNHSKVNKTDNINEQIKSIEVDHEGLIAYNARIDNGLRLFGKYARTLWD